jgi:hypothetical protein
MPPHISTRAATFSSAMGPHGMASGIENGPQGMTSGIENARDTDKVKKDEEDGNSAIHVELRRRFVCF